MRAEEPAIVAVHGERAVRPVASSACAPSPAVRVSAACTSTPVPPSSPEAATRSGVPSTAEANETT
jgi:hypothetical protein